jgi:hypothetical protein
MDDAKDIQVSRRQMGHPHQTVLTNKGNKIVNAPSSESENERAGQVVTSGQALQP